MTYSTSPSLLRPRSGHQGLPPSRPRGSRPADRHLAAPGIGSSSSACRPVVDDQGWPFEIWVVDPSPARLLSGFLSRSASSQPSCACRDRAGPRGPSAPPAGGSLPETRITSPSRSRALAARAGSSRVPPSVMLAASRAAVRASAMSHVANLLRLRGRDPVAERPPGEERVDAGPTAPYALEESRR